MFLVIAVPFRMGTKHASGLAPSCRDDQDPSLSSHHVFSNRHVVVYVCKHLCFSFLFGGWVIYFRFLKTDPCLKVVIKG